MRSVSGGTGGRIERPMKKVRVCPPLESVSTITASGISAFDDGDFQKASKYFSQALFRMEISQIEKKLDSEPSQCCDDDDSSARKSSVEEYDEGMQIYTNTIPLHEGCRPDLISPILCYNIAQTCAKRGKQGCSRKWFSSALHKLEQIGTASCESILLHVKVLNCLGYSHYRSGNEENALKFCEQSLNIVSGANFGTRKYEAAALNCVGVIIFNQQNQTMKALGFFEQSLNLYRNETKSDESLQVQIANLLNNIGRAQYMRSEFDEALLAYEEALHIRIECLGNNSIDVAATLYNIGQTHQQLKNYKESLKCFMEFLRIAKSAFGEDSRDVALVYKAIAEIYQEENDPKLAHQYLKLALDAQQASVGRCSPEVGTTLNKLGNLCYEMKDFRSALRYYNDGLIVERATLPPGHQHIMITITNIAHVYKQLGNHKKALGAYKLVHQMQIKTFGDSDTQVAESLSSIGLMEYHLRDFESSFESYQEALRIRRQNLGTDEHSDIASTLNSIGLVLFKQEMFELAKKCFNESLRIRCKILGTDHRDVAILWYNIATIHFEIGEDDVAIKMFEETLRVERAALGDDHPDVVLTLQHLGQVYQQLGHFEKALEYFSAALDVERRRTGTKQLGVIARIMNLLGNVYLQLGRIDEMMGSFVEASRIFSADQQQSGETLVIAGYNFYGLSRTNPPCAPVA